MTQSFGRKPGGEHISASEGEVVSGPDASSLFLQDPIKMFLLSRRAMGCTDSTLEVYTGNLERFKRTVGSDPSAWTAQTIQRYLGSLRGTMKPISAHQHYRTVRTFLTWCYRTGILAQDAMAGVTMKPSKTLPRVPSDDAVLTLLDACSDTFEGRRNRALVALLVDSGLRIGEALRLRIADVDFVNMTLAVHGGKGGKDGMAHFDLDAARALRQWMKVRPGLSPDDFVFADRHGRPLSRSHGTHILHRLSKQASLDPKIGPHQLRHYCATSLLRRTGDLELVRRVLRHESLAMALRYTHLTASDISAKFRRASPLNNLRAGR